ncbi:MAG TPA: L-lactate dehydrogenase [Planctomycetota bacterium]|nr:L-lactate dehydrogenase [Planctomycetota bacterium]
MKVGIIGLGWVGSGVAISPLHSGIATELLLNDVREGVADAEAMDLSQGAPFYPTARVRATSVEGMKDADAVVICAGRGGKPSESRLDLLRDNASIMRNIGRQLAGGRSILIGVANPVDVLTRVLQEVAGRPPSRVLGTGTMLDTARLRHVLGGGLHIDSRSIHGAVVGEHGDSEVVLWSGARVGGRALRQWPGWDRSREPALAGEVRRAAYEIIRRRGATNHAIGLVTAALLRWVLRGERRKLTVSRVQEGALGFRKVALSLPPVVDRDGAVEVLSPEMDDGELAGLRQSADVLQKSWASLAP